MIIIISCIKQSAGILAPLLRMTGQMYKVNPLNARCRKNTEYTAHLFSHLMKIDNSMCMIEAHTVDPLQRVAYHHHVSVRPGVWPVVRETTLALINCDRVPRTVMITSWGCENERHS